MSKKWASNKSDQLLVENFKKFMEGGDFSADESLDLLAEEETPHEKQKYYNSAYEMQKIANDPRVQFLGYLKQKALDRTKNKSEQGDTAKEMFQKALELWFKGNIMSSSSLRAAEKRLSKEKGSWLGGKIQNFVKKSPLLMKMFRNKEYKNMMKNFDNFLIYRKALKDVEYDADQLPPEMKEFEKSLGNDFVARISAGWEKRFKKEEAEKRKKYGDPNQQSNTDGNSFQKISRGDSSPNRRKFEPHRPPPQESGNSGPFRENKEWSDHKKMKNLTENFRKFAEGGDFSSTLNEEYSCSRRSHSHELRSSEKLHVYKIKLPAGIDIDGGVVKDANAKYVPEKGIWIAPSYCELADAILRLAGGNHELANNIEFISVDNIKDDSGNAIADYRRQLGYFKENK